MDPIELIKFVGGLAGLGTAAFTFYDRFIGSIRYRFVRCDWG